LNLRGNRKLNHAIHIAAVTQFRNQSEGRVLYDRKIAEGKTHKEAIRALARHHMVGSMGQVGSAGDNEAMESSFSLLQKNVLNRQRWTTREEPRIAIITWVERTYHRRRRQDRLGRLTPIEYETITTSQATQTRSRPVDSTDP
jgi:putative transposase